VLRPIDDANYVIVELEFDRTREADAAATPGSNAATEKRPTLRVRESSKRSKLRNSDRIRSAAFRSGKRPRDNPKIIARRNAVFFGGVKSRSCRRAPDKSFLALADELITWTLHDAIRDD
jgi:hypothetical protein